jgi:outer membrane protein OmpA-like peptidoglycan-associated protein/tetratricopeptide (TPR) repeat protein
MNKYIIVLIFLLAGVGYTHAQTKAQYQKAADEAFQQKNYYAALTYYNEVLDFDSRDTNAVYKSAEAARLFNSYKVAIQKYEFALDTLGFKSDSLIYFHLGSMYQRVGNYTKAILNYDLYLSQFENPEDYYTKKAKVEKIACEWSISKMNIKDSSVTITRMKPDVNSPDSDFAPLIKDSTLLFSSMRFKEQKTKLNPPRQISKILKYQKDIVSVYDEKLNNTDLSLANTALSLDKKSIYFTKCEYVEPQKLRCQLYKGIISDLDEIIDVKKLEAPINDTASTTTHPSIGRFEGGERDVLFFVSDRKGGKGKLDIWYSEIFDNDVYGAPVNLSSINTVEDELTPFFHIKSNSLYFSSDGKRGFGGFDIFNSVFSKDSITETNHLLAPYNSSYHDLYYVLSDDFKKAYLSSNREGAMYVDQYLESCCYDLFELDKEEVNLTLKAFTYDKTTGLDLDGATVSLFDAETGELIAQFTNIKENKFDFDLERGKLYKLLAERPNFLPDSTIFSTKQITKSQEIVKKLYLEPDYIKLDAFTFDEISKEDLIGATVMIEDLTDPTQSRMVKINDLANDFHFDLERDKKYRISAVKDGYKSTSDVIDTHNSPKRIRKDLFLKKLNLNAYVPLALYFDNDQPEPRSRSTATSANYSTLMRKYLGRKKAFIANRETKYETLSMLEDFFATDIQGNYSKFSSFMDDLVKELKEGQRIEIVIKGYASPRFDLKYNLVLGQRRINSVKNEMLTYNKSALAPYILSNQLVVTQISYGEELAPANVNDKLNDQRGSVYSVRASKQRKVEVISVKAKL